MNRLYKFRPYYERDDYKYYGEWVGIFTGDAGVYFEPEVGALPSTVAGNNAELEGYAYAGTDDVSAGGIEYRLASAAGAPARAAGEWIRVPATSTTFFKVRLEGLAYDSRYDYRAYAVAGNNTYYGQTAQFSTGSAPAGIEDITADSAFEVSLLHNPVVGNPEVVVSGTGETVRCMIYSITGSLVRSCTIVADGTPQMVEANLAPGMYVVTVAGRRGAASVRMIAR